MGLVLWVVSVGGGGLTAGVSWVVVGIVVVGEAGKSIVGGRVTILGECSAAATAEGAAIGGDGGGGRSLGAEWIIAFTRVGGAIASTGLSICCGSIVTTTAGGGLLLMLCVTAGEASFGTRGSVNCVVCVWVAACKDRKINRRISCKK